MTVRKTRIQLGYQPCFSFNLWGQSIIIFLRGHLRPEIMDTPVTRFLFRCYLEMGQSGIRIVLIVVNVTEIAVRGRVSWIAFKNFLELMNGLLLIARLMRVDAGESGLCVQ